MRKTVLDLLPESVIETWRPGSHILVVAGTGKCKTTWVDGIICRHAGEIRGAVFGIVGEAQMPVLVFTRVWLPSASYSGMKSVISSTESMMYWLRLLVSIIYAACHAGAVYDSGGAVAEGGTSRIRHRGGKTIGAVGGGSHTPEHIRAAGNTPQCIICRGFACLHSARVAGGGKHTPGGIANWWK